MKADVSYLVSSIQNDKLKRVDLDGQEWRCLESGRQFDFKGCIIEHGSILIDGSNNRIKGLRSEGVPLRMNGSGNGVEDSSFSNIESESAVILYNKYRHDLARAMGFVERCVFDGSSGGQATVLLSGTGMACTNCTFTDQGHRPIPAIKLCGSKHIVSYNDIEYVYHKGNSDDAGAIVIGRRWDWVGNSISNNSIYCMNPHGVPCDKPKLSGIYLDDGISFVSAFNNTVVGFPIGVKLGGGSFNDIENNRFLFCENGVRFDARYSVGYLKPTQSKAALDAIQRDSQLWREYGAYLDHLTGIPTGNSIQNNRFVECGSKVCQPDGLNYYGQNAIDTMNRTMTLNQAFRQQKQVENRQQ